jgi:glutathione peroxidase
MFKARRVPRAAHTLLALGLTALVGSVQAATCPALLDRSVPRLQDEQPQSLCQYAGKVVLGFPSNDFGGQEPGSATEIAAFCENQFAVKFPMFSKVTVKGDKAHPFYAELLRDVRAMLSAR